MQSETRLFVNYILQTNGDIFDENMDEYRPDYHIKNKKNGLIISFGPKIKEREPYADIDWDLLEKNTP